MGSGVDDAAKDSAADREKEAGPDEAQSHEGPAFSVGDVEDIERSSKLRAPMIYEVLRREGDEEMSRPVTSLWWSGVAAGLSISFSLVVESILQAHLTDTPWRHLIVSLGYTVGFLMTVLARQQLFTENTITAVLPVAADFNTRNLWRMGRVWSVVLIANFCGTFAAALFYSFTPTFSHDLISTMLDLSRQMMAHSPVDMLCKAIAAGFLIAAMVWLIPSADAAHFHVIVLMTYVIAAGDLSHIIAGSLEAFMLILNGQGQIWALFTGFALPTLIGNIIGGTLLFSLISYAQVAKEV
jgi:formate/nitrite transporter FocA (FNT family)